MSELHISDMAEIGSNCSFGHNVAIEEGAVVGGAVYALSNDIMSSAFFRPRLRSRAVPGLYLTGASTHFSVACLRRSVRG